MTLIIYYNMKIVFFIRSCIKRLIFVVNCSAKEALCSYTQDDAETLYVGTSNYTQK